jgi:hypothetical protein
MGNSAWLQIARLAWNLGKWIAEIALPSEVVRWEWKRFRRHFVYIAAKVLKKGLAWWYGLRDRIGICPTSSPPMLGCRLERL